MQSESLRTVLADEWHRLMNACKVGDAEARARTFAHLLEAYSESHRHYHNLHHIRWMLDSIALDVEYGDPISSLNYASIRLATWYHDVVYDPRSAENESRSAAVARESLCELGIKHGLIERVADLILLTNGHEAPPDDLEARVFLDLDLSILGATPLQYEQYARAIREEYHFVNDYEFYPARRNVLEGFLSRPGIFRSYWFGYLETRARANLAAEIARIDERGLAAKG